MNQEDAHPSGDHIETNIGDDARNVTVGKDINSVNIGDVEGGIHDSTIIQTILNIFQGAPFETRELRNRTVMLNRVREYWIEGVLEQSLYESILIKLGISVTPNAVVTKRPWSITIQTPEQPEQQLPQNKPIIDIFDEMKQSLLILGEPGSGKTTTLLELARDLLTRTEKEPAYPIPTVFNLSSWADKREPISEWLVEELIDKYAIPKKLAQSWIENDAVLPLLDGLDEVAEPYRDDCVRGINQYHQERANILPIAVCCRVDDYNLLPTRLELQNAIQIEPLTSQQITDYFNELGGDFQTVRQAIQQDQELQEEAQLPLMLNVIAVAFGGMDSEELKAFSLGGNYQKELFNRYIKKIFTYRGDKATPYYHQQTLRWLNWLAGNMSHRGQTIFLIERVQPDWLLTYSRVWLYGLIFGLSGGLLFGLIPWLSGDLKSDEVFGTLVSGIFIGLYIGLMDIEPVEKLKFGWKQGLIVLLIFWVGNGLSTGLSSGLSAWLGGGLYVGLVYGLIAGLFWGLRGRAKEISQTTDPNQGTWCSVRNMLIVWLITWLITWLISWVVLGLGFGLSNGLVFGLLAELSAGLFVGLLVALFGGGLDAIKHLMLRIFLWGYNYAPLNYARFLDYCHERIFLRKVGGGYIFIHRMLMEHFAQLSDEDIQRLSSG